MRQVSVQCTEMGFNSFLFRWFAFATVVVRLPHRKVVNPTSAGAPLGKETDWPPQVLVATLTLSQPGGRLCPPYAK